MNNNSEQSHIFRYHPMVIIKGIFKYIVILLVFFRKEMDKIIKNGFSLQDLEIDYGVIVILGGIILVLALISAFNGYIKYKKSYLEITSQSVTFKQNTFFHKSSKESQLKEVSNIHFSKTILDGILGCTTMTLDINSTATANQEDYSIYLSRKRSQEFKAIYDRYKRINQSGVEVLEQYRDDADMEAERFDYVYHYNHSETIKHIFLDGGIGLILFGVGSFTVTIMDVFENFSIVALVLFIATAIWDFFRKLAKYYNYTVKSNDTHIMWNYGLFTEESFTIEKRNINSIEIKQEFLARVFGLYEVRIKVVGIGNLNDEIQSIVLYSKKEKAFQILNEILPNNDMVENFDREDIRVSIIRMMVWILIFMPLLFIPIVRRYYYIFFPALFLIGLATFFSSRGKGFAYKNGKITILSSLISSEINLVNVDKIEHIVIKNNLIYNKWELAKIDFHYKDNIGFGSVSTGFVNRKMFEKIIFSFKK